MTTLEIILICAVFVAFYCGAEFGWRCNVMPRAKIVINKSLQQMADAYAAYTKGEELKRYVGSRLDDTRGAIAKITEDKMAREYVKGLKDAYFDIYARLTGE